MKNRRQMITDAMRYAALGLVGFFTGFEIVKKRRLIEQGRCIGRGICSGCNIYEECRLPQALSKKQWEGNVNRKK